ncbi:MAG: hypothetical protein JSR82_08035 [Verrucomicrobia bacterium]|nr:hypothetical protein [Verrucomicrobiota bacterium]
MKSISLTLLALALSACSQTPAEWAERGDGRLVRNGNYRLGYLQAQSDAIKREYWRRQEAERGAPSAEEQGRTVYYTLPGPRETADGVTLAPHTITVPIVE